MPGRDERGVGTVLTAGVCAVLLAVASMSAVLVAWLAQVSATQAAADLSALAAAGARSQGGDVCGAADHAAGRNGTQLVACRVQGDEWSFVVEVSVSQALRPALPGVPATVERTATAGTLR